MKRWSLSWRTRPFLRSNEGVGFTLRICGSRWSRTGPDTAKRIRQRWISGINVFGQRLAGRTSITPGLLLRRVLEPKIMAGARRMFRITVRGVQR